MNSEDNRQLVPLRELIATTLEAAIEADMAALRCYYDNLCELAFDSDDAEKQAVPRLRHLSFSYANGDGQQHQVKLPVLSLLPLPMLQMKGIDFSMDAQLVEMRNFDSDGEKTNHELYVSLAPQSQAFQEEKSIATGYSAKINISMQQSDMPGGMARLLQMVNNLNL